MLQKTLELLSNIPITLLQSITGHLCCLKIIENKVRVSGGFPRGRGRKKKKKQATSSDLKIGNRSPLQALFVKNKKVALALACLLPQQTKGCLT